MAAVLLLIIVLSGCSASTQPDRWQKPGKVAVYECDQGVEFVIDSQPDTAWLFLPGQTVTLPHVRSASGARYRNDKIGFWSKGNEALLDLQGDRTYHCHENRVRSIWEDAKLRGVAFRAVGNEPGWHLEIGPEEILLISSYGEEEDIFQLPDPETDQQARRTIYRTKELEIILEGHTCTDSMSGEGFETTVTLKYRNQALKGCGKALH